MCGQPGCFFKSLAVGGLKRAGSLKSAAFGADSAISLFLSGSPPASARFRCFERYSHSSRTFYFERRTSASAELPAIPGFLASAGNARYRHGPEACLKVLLNPVAKKQTLWYFPRSPILFHCA